ncbi:NAD(P)H-dependent oxidoreductase, partial [Streptomyces sp. DSM 42041]
MDMDLSPLTALALVCTLNRSPAESSSQLLAEQVLNELRTQEVCTELVRVVDYDILPGVAVDMGEGDQWPQLRQKILDADILVLAT